MNSNNSKQVNHIKTSRNVSVFIYIILLLMIIGLVYFIYINDNKETGLENEETTTTETSSSTESTSKTTVTKTTKKTTTKITTTLSTKEKETSADKIVTDIEKKLNSYSNAELISASFSVSKIYSMANNLSASSTTYYNNTMAEGIDDILNIPYISSKINIYSFNYGTKLQVLIRLTNKKYDLNNVINTRAYFDSNNKENFTIFFLTTDGVYTLEGEKNSTTFNKITNNVYTDIVYHLDEKTKNLTYYYIESKNNYYTLDNKYVETAYDTSFSNTSYETMTEGILKINKNTSFSNYVTLSYNNSTKITVKIKNSDKKVNNGKDIETTIDGFINAVGYIDSKCPEYFNIYIITNKGVYLITKENDTVSLSDKVITSTVYSDVVYKASDSTCSNQVTYYYVKNETNYINQDTNEKEIHDDVKTAYDDNVYKINIDRTFYYKHNLQSFKYGIGITNGNNLLGVISQDQLLYILKDDKYTKYSNLAVESTYLYNKNNQKYLVLMFDDGSEYVFRNSNITNLPK